MQVNATGEHFERRAWAAPLKRIVRANVARIIAAGGEASKIGLIGSLGLFVPK